MYKSEILFWLVVCIYEIWYIKHNYIRFNKDRRYFKYMAVILIMHVFACLYIGLSLGFVKSPYSHEFGKVLKNIFVEIVPIIGIELTRVIFLTRYKNNKLAIITITLILMLVEVKYDTLLDVWSSKEKLFEYIFGYILSIISYGIINTYLTMKCSVTITLIIRIIMKLSVLLSPVLINVNWFAIGSFSLIESTIIYVILRYADAKHSEGIVKIKKSKYEKFSYASTIILCVTLVCFMLGFFKYEAITILSNSMTPVFNKSDVVIYKKLSEEEKQNIPIDTIILYTSENQNIMHRVVNKVNEDGQIKYQTKGDSNNICDTKFVEISQIKGMYVFHIKYAGILSVWLYEIFNNEIEI